MPAARQPSVAAAEAPPPPPRPVVERPSAGSARRRVLIGANRSRFKAVRGERGPASEALASLLGVALALSLALGGCDRAGQGEIEDRLPDSTSGGAPGQGPAATIEVDDATYRDLVGAFYTGVTAIHVGDNETARASFTRATELVPEEASGWANLALTELRMGAPEPASAALAEAARLAPFDSRIAHLSALSALRAGDREAGEAELRRALELDPANVRARYTLFEELRRSEDEADAAEALDALLQILDRAPDNLVALIDLAVLQSESGADGGGVGAGGDEGEGEGQGQGTGSESGTGAGEGGDLDATLDRLSELSATWPEAARAELQKARAAAASGDGRATSIALIGTNNLLLASPPHEQALAELKSPPTAVGEPLEHFIALPAPSAQVAEADTALRFETTGAPGPAGTRFVRAASGGEGRAPIVVVGADDGVRIGGGQLVGASAGDGQGGAAGEGEGEGEGAATSSLPLPDGAAPLDPSAVTAEGVAFVDVDNDSVSEVVVAGGAGVRVFRVDDAGAWSDVTAESGVPDDALAGEFTSVHVFDVELDGDLDLLLGSASGAPVVLRNSGDGAWAAESPLPDVEGVRAAVWADVDGDGDPDLALIDGRQRLQILTNERSDRYVVTDLGPLAESAMAITVADTNLDGVLDLVVLRADGSVERIAVDFPGAAGPEAWSAEVLASVPASADDVGGGAHVALADLDNNGAADLVVSTGGASSIWLAGADGAFGALEGTEAAGVGVTAIVDLDGDGRLDLLGASGGVPAVLGNTGGGQDYSWLAIRPKAILTGDQRNNAFGIGGEIDLRAGLLYQKRPIDSSLVHFGLGEHDMANVVRVRWPNGSAQGEFDLDDDAVVTAEQRLKGSCPWLFTWDGAEMTFVTDVLWRSPLGLRINAQQTAGVVMARDWVKVRGDQLRPRDGRLEAAVTAELWETHYFDEFGLIAIDHPEGTEVWVDERFSIPPPPLDIVVTGPLSPPRSVVDGAGRDVTAMAAELDEVFVDTFPLGRYQGLTEEHSIEIEIGDEDRADRTSGGTAERGGDGVEAGPLYLVAQGWIRPTDSSINVALSQGSQAPPRGLRLEVADDVAPGGWRELEADLGFPAGKRKAMLIDLSDAWPAGFEGERRVRLSTNMEIYWDRLATAIGVPPPASGVVRQDLAPATAEILPRGFSYTTHFTPSGEESAPVTRPEIPDYERIAASAPIWLDLVGFYTRYGDVVELVRGMDDRYVITNAGDEVRLAFDAPPDPPAGMLRDYVFVSVGWEKDGDFNTAYSKTVHPLPSHDRPEYVDQVVYGEAGALHDDPVYQAHAEDWVRYHTRWVSPAGFVRALVVE